MPPCLPWLPCGLHKFCLKYFLKSFATHTRAHTHTHSHTLATFGCGDMHNLLRAVLAVCLLLVVLVDCAVALRINAICLDIRTINSSTRVAASCSGCCSCCCCCSQRVANPDHVWRRCPAHMTHTPRGSQLNAQRNYLTTWPIPITLPTPRYLPLSLAVPFGRQDTTEKFSNRCARRSKVSARHLVVVCSLSHGRTNFLFKVTANK